MRTTHKTFKQAFTLIELLVVIAIIALLLSILTPALNLAKRKAATAVCLISVKNLSLGWYSYKEDNRERIMSAQMEAREDNGTFVGWTGTPRDIKGQYCTIDQTDPVTDEDEIRGIEAGKLFEYMKTSKSYHCPADNIRKSKYDGTPIFLSYSIARCLYGHPNSSDTMYNLQIKKYNEISSPSSRSTFIEVAQTRNWNSSHWFSLGAPEYTNDLTRWGWWDPMAVNHGDSSVLVFADAHAEVHKWRDPYTRERVNKLIDQDVDLYDWDFPKNPIDVDYVGSTWAYRYKGTGGGNGQR
jgi:prepilin-type N-terminal cleavage/methylation domain-containing protein